jgi:septin family protein
MINSISYGRLIISETSLYFRFEQIGNRSKFTSIMDDFNNQFPSKLWNERKRAWQFPISMKDELVQFCLYYFGPFGCVLQSTDDVRAR